MSKPVGVHLVGSVPLRSEKEVWAKAFESLRGRLATVPDGETGSRLNFTQWQKAVFPLHMHSRLFPDNNPASKCPEDLESMPPTKYDQAAVASYQVFCKLRAEGKIQPGVRFQVSIPGSMNSIYANVTAEYQASAIEIYEKRLMADIERLQEQIPSQDLAIQIDMAAEFALLEHSRGMLQGPMRHFFKPYFISDDNQNPFPQTKRMILEKTMNLAKLVRPETPLGFHLCYGDIEHQHFIQPLDAGLLVEVANSIVEELKPTRLIDWIHLPCPKERKDVAYYLPLQDLDIGAAKLFLGVVHAHDLPGTEERIKTAQSVY